MNPTELNVYAGRLAGLDRASDETDLPLGLWRAAENTMTFAREQYQRTRDGLLPATTRLFSEPVPLLGGAGGGTEIGSPVDLPFVIPDDTIGYDGDTALKLVATPDSGNATLGVTFTVYGMSDLGITTLDWDFSVEGSRSSDESGSSTSTTHDYTAAGTYVCAVWGTGSDSQVYIAKKTIIVEASGGASDPTPPTATLTVDGNSTDFTTDPGVVSVAWSSTNADNAYLNGEQVGVSGTKTETLTEGVYFYTFSAFNNAGQVDTKTVSVTVEGDAASNLPPTVSLSANPFRIDDGDTVAFSIESERSDSTMLYIGAAAGVDITASTSYSAAVSRPASAATDEDYLITATAVAMNDYGTARSDVAILILADGTDEEVAFLTISHDAQVKTETNFDVTVSAFAADGVTPAPVPAGLTLLLLQNSDTSGITNNFSSVSPSWDAERLVATFSGCQMALPSGDSGDTDIYAELVTQELVTPLSPITVYDDGTYFDVDTVISSSVSLTTIDAEYDAPDCEAVFYVSVIPRDDGDDSIVTDYGFAATPKFAVTDGWPEDPSVTFDGVCAGTTYTESAAQPLVGGAIPSTVFVAGSGYTIVKVTVRWHGNQGDPGGYPLSDENEHFLDVQFSAEKYNG